MTAASIIVKMLAVSSVHADSFRLIGYKSAHQAMEPCVTGTRPAHEITSCPTFDYTYGTFIDNFANLGP